ncbi:hypothetical protein RDABS01_024845 [Bienertia sinuspersici]
MFKCYSQNKDYNELISLFGKMMESHVKPSCYSIPLILKACGKVSSLCRGEQVHSFVIKSGFETNPFVGNTLIEMYFGSGNINLARELFDLVRDKDVILWNKMISGYIEIGDMETAQKLFDEMPCKDIMSWNTMLNGYANNGKIEACEKLFEVMPKRNVYSWNGLIGAYANQGSYFEVLTTFKRILSEAEVVLDDATLVFVLLACARLGALDQGMWLHVYAQRIGYKGNIYVENALIDMYAKCGRIEYAVEVFKGMVKRDLVSWNTIISGLAMHGHASNALTFVERMKKAGVKPDGVTFLAVLCACTHIGLVDEGLAYFQSMADYCISPQVEHYGCLIDLYARSGHLSEALNLVKIMPMEQMLSYGVLYLGLLGYTKMLK